MSAQLSSSLNMMLEFGDLIRSRSNSFRQASRKSSKSRRTSSASQNSSPDRSCSAKTSSPMHTQTLGMFLIVPAVHGRSTHTSTVILITCIFMKKIWHFSSNFRVEVKAWPALIPWSRHKVQTCPLRQVVLGACLLSLVMVWILIALVDCLCRQPGARIIHQLRQGFTDAANCLLPAKWVAH